MTKAPCINPEPEQIHRLRTIIQSKIKWPIAMLVLKGGYWWVAIVTGSSACVSPEWYKVTELLRATPTEDL